MAALAFTAACGDDDDDDDGNTGGNGNEPVNCTDTYAGWTSDDLAADTSGACEDDTATICVENVPGITGTCGAACFMDTPDDEAMILACTRTCVQGQLDTELSEGCLDCYVQAVDCARENCALMCGSDPSSDACVECRNENNCTSGFFVCSGLPLPTPAGAGGAGSN